MELLPEFKVAVGIGDRILHLDVTRQEHYEDDAARTGHTPPVARHLAQSTQRHAQQGLGQTCTILWPRVQVVEDRETLGGEQLFRVQEPLHRFTPDVRVAKQSRDDAAVSFFVLLFVLFFLFFLFLIIKKKEKKKNLMVPLHPLLRCQFCDMSKKKSVSLSKFSAKYITCLFDRANSSASSRRTFCFCFLF